MENNPYANPYATAPANPYADSGAYAAQVAIPQGVLLELQNTRPWARFLSIMYFILGGLFFVGGIGMALLSGSMEAIRDSGNSSAYQAGYIIGGGLTYGVLSLFIFYPAMKLGKYAGNITRLLANPTVDGLDAALGEQRRLWTYAGVMALIMIGLFLVGIVAAIVIPAMQHR